MKLRALTLCLPIAALGLSGCVDPYAAPNQNTKSGAMTGAMIGGLYGGVSGIWGPPLIVYLLAIKAEKQETIRVQGVVFLIGAVVLASAHLQSGVLNAASLPFSAVLVLPAVVGMLLGYAVQDRLDQRRFRRWTQILLLLTGLNLLRRAFGV